MTKTLTTTEELRHLASSYNANELTRSLARELLAIREAQPVGVDIERIERHVLHAAACPPYSRVVLFSSLQRLFTAPPATVVNPEFTGATAVPKAIITAPVEAMRCGPAASYVMGWNACRAAMLAQPVSQGCEWTYDEHDYKWDSACGEAWMFSDGGPIENGVKFCQSCGKPVLLAAAPEGGNG